MGIEEDINMPSLNAATAVLRGINNTAYHELASIRNDSWVHRDGLIGSSNGSCAGAAAPVAGALPAGTVGGCFNRTDGAEINSRNRSANAVYRGTGQLLP